jgi:hypothetical protein
LSRSFQSLLLLGCVGFDPTGEQTRSIVASHCVELPLDVEVRGISPLTYI